MNDLSVLTVYYNQSMTDTAHIYTPQDESLEERIRAYRSVREAYINAEASVRALDDEEWANRLGEREEIERAFDISARSLQMATKAISQDELKQAQNEGLLSKDEVVGLVQSKRQQEMRDSRDKSRASESTSSSQKQR